MVPDSRNISWKRISPNCFYGLHWPGEQMSISISPHPRLHWILFPSLKDALPSRIFCTLIFMSSVVVRPWEYSRELDPGPSWPGAPSPVEETEAVTRCALSAGRGRSTRSLIPGSPESPGPALGHQGGLPGGGGSLELKIEGWLEIGQVVGNGSVEA